MRGVSGVAAEGKLSDGSLLKWSEVSLPTLQFDLTLFREEREAAKVITLILLPFLHKNVHLLTMKLNDVKEDLDQVLLILP